MKRNPNHHLQVPADRGKSESTNELEWTGPTAQPSIPRLSQYIAAGLLIAFTFYSLSQIVALLSGNSQLYPYFVIQGNRYPPGAIPNSDAGGGWDKGPLFFLALLLGMLGGWLVFNYVRWRTKKTGRHM